MVLSEAYIVSLVFFFVSITSCAVIALRLAMLTFTLILEITFNFYRQA